MYRPKALIIICTLLVAGGIAGLWFSREVKAPKSSKNLPASSVAPAFNKQRFSVDDPSSVWVIVNKQRALPASYAPAGLRQPKVLVRSSGSSEMLIRDEAATAVEKLVSDAAGQGIKFMLVSGYRSYGLQSQVYNGNVKKEGRASADQTSARPGHSEHQTGLAADLGASNRTCELQTCFANTPEGQWLATHAHEYGFVIRYQDGKQPIVGYSFEPWHIRYVGTELSQEIHKNNDVTLEEFFGLPAAPNY